jgi:hypothetical protein
MSGSTAEVQALADQILELLGVRIRSGELVVRYADGLVQKCETRTVHNATVEPIRPARVDKGNSRGAH